MAIDGDLNVQTNVMNLHTIMSDDKHLIDINGAADHMRERVVRWALEKKPTFDISVVLEFYIKKSKKYFSTEAWHRPPFVYDLRS